MPLRHSPRASPALIASASEPQPKTNVSRDPSLTSIASDNDSSTTGGVTVRKRKRSDAGIKEFREEIIQMFNMWKTEQDKKISVILSTGNDIRDQNIDIRTSIEFISKNYEDLIQKIDKLEAERNGSLRYIKTLENKIEQIERGQNCSRIEMRGIPRAESESKKSFLRHVHNMGKALNVSLQPNDIRNVYRINTKSDKIKPIIVEFNSVVVKEDILKSLKTFNRQNKEKFNTIKLQIEGTPAPVFISECLTAQTRKLFASARMFARDNCYRYCWTSFGRIYLRKSEGDKLIRVDSDQDLDKLK